jgi:pimeloyl-ACP methyl ester carboxylesterase
MTEFLKIGSKSIEILWHKKGHKGLPTLVFLHEGLGCVDMWKDFPLKLSQKTGCPALVFSRFGYGRSDSAPLPWKLNFMHQNALTILPELLNQAKIKNYILIGHSDGGSIGIIFAGSPYANGLKGLITMAAHVFCEQISVDCIKEAKINFEQTGLRQSLEKYHGGNTENAFWGWNDVWLHPNFMHWNIEKYLGRIKVPVLAIQGKEDQYGTLKQLDSIKKGVENIEACLVDECRHSAHLEQPEKTIELMTQFIFRIL